MNPIRRCAALYLAFLLLGAASACSRGLSVRLEAPAAPQRADSESPIRLRFSEPMDTASAATPLRLEPRAAGRTSWDEGGQVLTFTPVQGFRAGSTYQLSLDPALRSAEGEPIEQDPTWEITILLPPRVTELTREPLGRAGRRFAYLIEFNKPMDHATVENALQVEPEAELVMGWDEESLIVETSGSLAPGVLYEFTISPAATDNEGLGLAEAYHWTQRMPSEEPELSLQGVAGGDTPLLLAFPYAVTLQSVMDSFRIDPEVGGSLHLRVTRDQEDPAQTSSLRIIFTPEVYWPVGEEFTVSWSAPLEDADGERYPAPEPTTFATSPAVLRVTPGSAETADAERPIQIGFSRPMDHASVETALVISPETTGDIEWSDSQLTFRPEGGYWAEETSYTITLATTALDDRGAPVLEEDYSWSFETGRLPAAAWFYGYPNVVRIEPGDSLDLPYSVFVQTLPRLTFELYRLTPEQFAYRYVRFFHGAWSEDESLMPVQGLVSLSTWGVDSIRCGRDYGCQRTVSLPSNLASGYYLLNLTSTHLEDQVLIVVGRHLLTAKAGGGQVLVWATNESGQPIGDINISVYSDDTLLAAEGVTDAQGLYEGWVYAAEPELVLGEIGGEVAAVGLSGSWTSVVREWPLDWWIEGWLTPGGPIDRVLGHIHTDRPIYRPGQTVYYRAVVRRDQDALITLLPEGTPVEVRVRDARHNLLETTRLTTNSFGSVNGSFQLGEGVMLGDYTIEITVGDETSEQIFRVEEYRKPDYQVIVETDAERYVAGQPIEVSAVAEYFMGQPVTQGSVSYRRYDMGYVPDDWWFFSYTAPQVLDYEARVTGRTDEIGSAQWSFEAPEGRDRVRWGSSLRVTRLGIEVFVEDGSHQAVSGLTVVEVYNASESIEIDTGGYFHRPGEPIGVTFQVSGLEDQPVPGREVHFELLQYRPFEWRGQTRASADVTTDDAGQASYDLEGLASGWYEILATGTDPLGNEMEVSKWIFVSGAGAAHDFGNPLRIAADRETYAPGDTAHLLIESGFSGRALLTVERGIVRRQELISLTAPVTDYELSIRADDVPNIFVSVTAWAPPPEWVEEMATDTLPRLLSAQAFVELQVPPTGRELEVVITPERDSYSPGEVARFEIQVADRAGNPVVAELSAALVDEAIYALSEELAPPMLTTFYGRRALSVWTYDSASIMAYLFEGERGGGGGGPLFGMPRADFPDTAVWFPSIVTGTDGRAVIEATLPDSLTTWRLTVRAVSRDSRFGEQTASIVTQQAVVIRPMLPAELTEGDSASLYAMVHNYSRSPQALRVMLDSDLLVVADPAEQPVALRPGQSQLVRWLVRAPGSGEAALHLTAEGQMARDEVLVALPVRPLVVRQRDTQSGELQGDLVLQLDVPSDALLTSGLMIDLGRSVSASLLQGLDYLTGFPYGCVEQTMSAALPNAVVARAFHTLGATMPGLEADLAAKIEASVQRLYGFQHDDGGWGWFFDDQTNDYQTAWVVFGLALTAQSGYEVDPEVIQRGAEWLLEHMSEIDPRTQAFALYSLAEAGYGDLEQSLALLRQADDLDPFAQAALALALHTLGADDEARQVLDLLAESVSRSGRSAFWDIPTWDGMYNMKTMASATRATALALSAFTRIENPHGDLVPGISHWLMSHRQPDGWGTTNETAFSILGLTDFLLAAEGAPGPTEYAVVLNGESVSSGTLDADQSSVSLEIPVSDLQVGKNEIRLSQAGEGSLFYLVTSDWLLARSEVEADGVFQLTRQYLDPSSQAPVDEIVAGDLVLVRLTLHGPRDAAYAIVEDHLPGGLEPLNERLNSISYIAHEWDVEYDWLTTFWWEDYGYNFKEIRGGTVSFFVSDMPAGRRTFEYYARATHAGTFHVLPAEVWQMYDTSNWGRSSIGTLTVVERE